MDFYAFGIRWINEWSIPGLRHVFSPMGANVAIAEKRAKVYARMYQTTSEKWTKIGTASHGICLYAHDTERQAQFFRYGFGVRTIDAIRGMDGIKTPLCDGYSFSELVPKDVLDILPLDNMLDDSYISSPFFIYREQSSKAVFLKGYKHYQSIYFTAKYNGQIVVFIRAELDGETFIQDTPGYLHVKGAFCLPVHGGKGINQKLLEPILKNA